MWLKKRIKCSRCGKKLKPRRNNDGLPDAMAFDTDDGGVVIICRDCMVELAVMAEIEKRKRDVDKD